MSLPSQDKSRQVIPRWRHHFKAALDGELDSVTVSESRESSWPHQKHYIEERIHDWRVYKTTSFASDLVGTALVNGLNDDAIDAARFLLSGVSIAMSSAKAMARTLLLTIDKSVQVIPSGSRSDTRTILGQRIHGLKQRLRDYPHNALGWTDLGLDYVKLGHTDAAEKCISIASSLAPENRHVLRSAARFYVHINEPERALRILRRAPGAGEDPWIAAAEIAVSETAGVPSKFARRGFQIARSSDFSPRQVSELASAIATLESSAGGNRRARQLFERSLESPTENSVAQAEWASRVLKVIHLEPAIIDRNPAAHEAATWKHFHRGAWKDSLSSAWKWLEDQPFSHSPAVQGSYIAAVALEDYDEAIRIGIQGRISNPHEWLLVNNLTASYASKGDIQIAEETFSCFPKPEETDKLKYGTWSATSGLICFKKGEFEKGRALYMKAVDALSDEEFKRTKAIALLFLAREEQSAGTAEAPAAISRAAEFSKGIDNAEVKMWLDKLTSPGGKEKSKWN